MTPYVRDAARRAGLLPPLDQLELHRAQERAGVPPFYPRPQDVLFDEATGKTFPFGFYFLMCAAIALASLGAGFMWMNFAASWPW